MQVTRERLPETQSQESVAHPVSGLCRTGGLFVDRCDRAGYSMVPRLVVCQIRAQPGGASGVRAGHGIAGEGL